MQLRIDQQYAKIGMNIQQPLLKLRSTLPAMELDIKEPRVQIRSPRPRIYIDQRQCFADMDKRTPEQFRQYYADIAKSEGLQAINTIASQGDMLGHIENNISIADIAASVMDNQVDFNVTAVPKQPPVIWADTRPVEIWLERGQVAVSVKEGRVEPDFRRGAVEVYLRQKNYLKIDWVEGKLNRVV